MQTIGYWCDECRRKYVKHACRGGLPCGHEKSRAIFIYCKAYRTAGESLTLIFLGQKIQLWLEYRKPPPHFYVSGELARTLHCWSVRHDHSETQIKLGAWLKDQPAILIRAFLNRWDSFKEPPDWRWVSQSSESLKVRDCRVGRKSLTGGLACGRAAGDGKEN